jgi:hypothetical protein
VETLAEAVSGALECAESGDVVLLSPACSSFDMFQSYAHRGEVFRQAVQQAARSSNRKLTHGSGGAVGNSANGISAATGTDNRMISPRISLRENSAAIHSQ